MSENTLHQILQSDQRLTITKHLVQAIGLLQVSNYDLWQIVSDYQVENPLLVIDNEAQNPWHYGPSSPYKESEYTLYEHVDFGPSSLQAYLEMQWCGHIPPKAIHAIGMLIITYIADTGYLEISLETISALHTIPLIHLEQTLSLIQTLEPSGVGARSLRECLTLQLTHLEELTPDMCVFLSHIEKLEDTSLEVIAHSHHLSLPLLQNCLKRIQALTPKPGLLIGASSPDLSPPADLVATVTGKIWCCTLNPDAIPSISLDLDVYNKLHSFKGTDHLNTTLRHYASQIHWLKNAIMHRAQAMVRVGNSILSFQADFFEKGGNYLTPLTLSMVADELGLHQSTISRIVHSKYMETPMGCYPLKLFFPRSSGSSDDSNVLSTPHVLTLLKRIIESEPPKSPYSDHQITELLHRENGVHIARRTVVKYRKILNIATASNRKNQRK